MIVLCLLTSDFPSENPHSQTRTFYTLNVRLRKNLLCLNKYVNFILIASYHDLYIFIILIVWIL
jgi:hypothetical protein